MVTIRRVAALAVAAVLVGCDASDVITDPPAVQTPAPGRVGADVGQAFTSATDSRLIDTWVDDVAPWRSSEPEQLLLSLDQPQLMHGLHVWSDNSDSERLWARLSTSLDGINWTRGYDVMPLPASPANTASALPLPTERVAQYVRLETFRTTAGDQVKLQEVRWANTALAHIANETATPGADDDQYTAWLQANDPATAINERDVALYSGMMLKNGMEFCNYGPGAVFASIPGMLPAGEALQHFTLPDGTLVWGQDVVQIQALSTPYNADLGARYTDIVDDGRQTYPDGSCGQELIQAQANDHARQLLADALAVR